MADYNDVPKIEENTGYTEPLPSVHPIKALALHGIFLLLQLLSWISTVVVFSAILHTVSIQDAKYACFWSHIEGGGMKISYSDWASQYGGYGGDCHSAGKGMVAMQVFAFISILATIVLTVVRSIGKSDAIPFIKTNTKSVFVEAWLSGISSVLFFISLLIWGGACYSSFQSQPTVTSVKATGFAFTIICFFFLMISVGVILYIRRDVTDDVINSSGFVHQSDSVSYHPSAYPPAVESNYGTAPAAGGDNYGSYHQAV